MGACFAACSYRTNSRTLCGQAPTLVDAEGKLRLRLRLQTTRIERKRDITPFPEAQ